MRYPSLWRLARQDMDPDVVGGILTVVLALALAALIVYLKG